VQEVYFVARRQNLVFAAHISSLSFPVFSAVKRGGGGEVNILYNVNIELP
jgi:hypothetical protein